jgi:putative transposase
VSDITYIPTGEGWLYLAVVIDLFSRRVLGWKLSESLHGELVTEAISRALDTGQVFKGAIFHSDRGCQYSAALTRDLLKRAGLRQSMSAKGYCYDNAFAESAFASIKADLFADGQSFPTRPAATTAIFDYFETFYNRRRRHSSLAYRSPDDFLTHYFQNNNSSLN